MVDDKRIHINRPRTSENSGLNCFAIAEHIIWPLYLLLLWQIIRQELAGEISMTNYWQEMKLSVSDMTEFGKGKRKEAYKKACRQYKSELIDRS